MFRKPSGLRYRRYFAKLHAAGVFDWYMEVGCRNGLSMAPARGKAIAVDPFFRFETNIINEKPALLAFQQKSDDFFASGILQKLGIRIDYSLLDGMHLFEYLLRDFMNTEPLTTPGGVIALHDCCPYTTAMTSRDLDNLPKGPWTGDVWKLIPILQQYRPDLKIDVLDCKPSGLVLLTNVDPSNRVLQENYDRIVADWTDVDIDSYTPERFYDLFEFTDTKGNIEAGFPQFANVLKPHESVATPEFVSR